MLGYKYNQPAILVNKKEDIMTITILFEIYSAKDDEKLHVICYMLCWCQNSQLWRSVSGQVHNNVA